MNTYKSIVPSEMTNFELQTMCTEIQTAKNWNLQHATVNLKNGQQYKVEVTRLQDYQQAYKTETNS